MGTSAFDPGTYGALLVEVKNLYSHLRVSAEPLSVESDPLHAYPQKQEQEIWIAAFPTMKAGNWSIVSSWRYSSDLSKIHEMRRIVTVFPGTVTRMTLG